MKRWRLAGPLPRLPAAGRPQDGFGISELAAVICQDSVYFKRAGFDKMFQKRQGMVCAHALEEFRVSVF